MNVEGGSGDEWFGFPRIHVSSTMTLAELEAHASGFYRSMREKYIHAGAGVNA
jgi:hypothetical protein